ncbi:hypothetical protein PC129_g13372 [Phytophthora cactorum]|uniref:Glycoside hydrolase superfamily n=1 Tax=Phytophthora cactorum TaxID=29920 RepID=A0A8T1LM90_9STRA|nr:hypothetical protein Pcac1_g22179 [Phytophthora cactorum]KAG2834907.1 hypothetical protein PC112_g5914 [Phytophthora cactorum]KAG2839191.1 hypothetical protein PC113_g19526 [Phytophthora cactorum]KAG2845164.1 hypothetical protein PC111_g1688 [Phytophthora cactorum]KAG2920789.1 hypothetical protein PC114_g5961 [Phytophthora cactorum]
MMMLGLLLLSALLWTRGARGSDEDAKDQSATSTTLQRDAQLEMPLQELLLAPLDGEDLDARLQRVFVQCRELGVTSIMYETATDMGVDTRREEIYGASAVFDAAATATSFHRGDGSRGSQQRDLRQEVIPFVALP